MKKALLPMLAILLFTACKKEITEDKMQESTAGTTANRTSPKMTICHHDALTGKNITIVIDQSAWPAHQAHGDVMGKCSEAGIVTILGKDWMLKNLDVATYRDGTPIPEVQDPAAWGALTTGAWCYHYNNTANGIEYGKLYNWYAVAGIHDNDPNTPNKILAPAGWHVPTDADWTTLSTGLDATLPTGNVGGKMKEAGTSHWQSPNTDATNSSGFTGLPGGYRFSGFNVNSFLNIGVGGLWWTADDNGAQSLRRELSHDNGILKSLGTLKTFGLSVRLQRD